jgi:Flp pilus assembly secretin CpaC
MDEIVSDEVVAEKRARRRWLPRFRVATLLWLMALVAAFFFGRQSKEVESLARRWWAVSRVRLGANVAEPEVINWPPGSITVNGDTAIRSVDVDDPEIVEVKFLNSRQLQVSPKSDGETWVEFKTPGGKWNGVQLRVQPENGSILDWNLGIR